MMRPLARSAPSAARPAAPNPSSIAARGIASSPAPITPPSTSWTAPRPDEGRDRVKPPVFEYVAVASAEEALAELADHGEDAKLLAGGQSLMPLLNMRLAAPGRLVDLNRVGSLSYIVERAGGVAVRALPPPRAIAPSGLLPPPPPPLPPA